MLESVSNFYMKYMTNYGTQYIESESKDGTKVVKQQLKTDPIWSPMFLVGAFWGLGLLINDLALSILYSFGVVITLSLNEQIKEEFMKNFKQIPVHLGVISVGILGTFFPGTVNEEILGIPAKGLIHEGEEALNYLKSIS
jgi:hypothetical protein